MKRDSWRKIRDVCSYMDGQQIVIDINQVHRNFTILIR